MSPPSSSTAEERQPSLFSPRACRLYIAFLLMFGLFCTSSMRSSLGMAIVCMVNASAYSSSSVILHDEKPETNFSLLLNAREHSVDACDRKLDASSFEAAGYQGSLLWSPRQQSLLFSAPFFGALFTMLPSGYIADRFGPKWTFAFAGAVFVLCTMITPVLATASYAAYLIDRFAMGIGEGVVMPSIAALICRWFPATERSTVTALYTSGNQFANIFATLISAQLCASAFLGGWPAIFYGLGTLGLLWLLVWSLFASNTPIEHKLIGHKERNFLMRKSSFVPSSSHKHVVPWRAILTSSAVYANFLAMFAAFFGGTVVGLYAPTYFRDVLRLDVKTNGLFTAAPYVLQLIVKNILGPVSDQLKKRHVLSSTAAVRLFQAVAAFGSGGALLGLALLVDCHRPGLALVFVVFLSCSNACNIPGVLTSLLCIAPPHTGVLQAMGQASGTIGAGLSPLFIGLVTNHGSQAEWRLVFLFTSAVFIVSGIVYLFFGSGEQQPWSQLPTPSTPAVVESAKIHPAIASTDFTSSADLRRTSVIVI